MAGDKKDLSNGNTIKLIQNFMFLFISDVIVIFLSIACAFFLRKTIGTFFDTSFTHSFLTYISFWPFYFFVIALFIYEGIYTKRFDFWHESRLIAKSIILAFFLTMAYLAMTKTIDELSRLAVTFSFLFMLILIPVFKYFTKHLLFRIGAWKQPAYIYDKDPFLIKEVFSNPYLGYIQADQKKARSLVINSKNMTPQSLTSAIDTAMNEKKEVVFIPLLNDFDLSRSTIHQLFNTHTNLITLSNNLNKPSVQLLNFFFNYALAFLLLPFLLPLLIIIATFIKIESPGSIFFIHHRIGKGGKVIPTLKFRSMYTDAQERLEELLKQSADIRHEWETNFKLKNDPRITKVGAFLRKTSLDELPQIFNVLKGDMNFVGPRPVVQEELDKYYKEDAKYYLMVKPGITGLWQVSGRSDTDYEFRVKTDKWYVNNWSLWLDIVILFKTIKVVLRSEGAY